MSWITILALAISSSIDNLGVGISYGIRGIRINFFSNLIISIIAFIFSEAGILFGGFLSKVLPGTLSNVIGALFLLIIGLRIILLTIPRRKKEMPSDLNKRNETSFSTSFTGYLSSPEKADFDQSGDIGFFEAIVLGIAVS